MQIFDKKQRTTLQAKATKSNITAKQRSRKLRINCMVIGRVSAQNQENSSRVAANKSLVKQLHASLPTWDETIGARRSLI